MKFVDNLQDCNCCPECGHTQLGWHQSSGGEVYLICPSCKEEIYRTDRLICDSVARLKEIERLNKLDHATRLREVADSLRNLAVDPYSLRWINKINEICDIIAEYMEEKE